MDFKRKTEISKSIGNSLPFSFRLRPKCNRTVFTLTKKGGGGFTYDVVENVRANNGLGPLQRIETARSKAATQ